MPARLMALAALALALASTGCNKNVFYASAPAKAGWIYVVGAKNDRAQLWLCPAVPGKGRCQEVDVVEADR